MRRPASTVAEIGKPLAANKVLVVGVAVIDFVFQVDEMPRRAEKYRARDAAITGGGCAANAAAAIARLGGKAHLAARIGADAIGDLIVADLERDGIDCSLVRQFDGKRSSFSSVYLDAAGERQIMSFRDTSLPYDADWLQAALTGDDFTFAAVLADTRWGKGAGAAMAVARDRAVPGILDAEAPFDDCGEALRLASHIAFSAHGLRTLTGNDSLEDALDRIASGRQDFFCVTDGVNGVTWRHGERRGHVAAFPVTAVDTLGAGDVWHGAFALRLAEGAEEEDAIRFASAYAALKCSRFGGRSSYPDRAETERLLGSSS